MDSKTFLLNKILDFAKKFDEYSYKYWVDDTGDNHFVEVIPSTYKVSDEFIDEEVDLLELFYSVYFNDSLSFVTGQEIKLLGELNLVKKIDAVCLWDNNYVKIDPSGLSRDIIEAILQENGQDFNYALAA